MYSLINAIGFQTGWWACIAGVGRGLEIPALAFCAVLAVMHLCWAKSPLQEIKLAAIALVIGVFLDSLLQLFGVISFYGWSLGPLSPFWLWMLWVLFAMTLNASLSFLLRMPLQISALLGLLFGPLTYYAGAQLGAASLKASYTHILSLALVWMLALPALVLVAKKNSTQH